MKALFNVEESKIKCPPEKLYPKGVRFKKRIVLTRGKNGVVTYHKHLNPRVLHVMTDKVPELKDSFLVNGYDNTNAPPTVKVDPDNSNRFIGLSGYHRDAAAEQLGWDSMIYDVLEFDSPKDERVHRTTSNHHRFPFNVNTQDDIVKQVKEAIANKEIQNVDYEIKDLISLLAADKTPVVQKNIFKKFRSHVSASSTIRNYHTQGGQNSTKEFALEYNLPYEGDENYSKTGKLGYLTGIKTPKTTLYDAKKLSMDYNGKDVEIYSWIKDNPKEAPAIYKQREDWKTKFDEFIKQDCEFIKYIAEKCGYNIPLNKLIENHPVKFKGYMAQDISPNPLNNGNPNEQGLVDTFGKTLVHNQVYH